MLSFCLCSLVFFVLFCFFNSSLFILSSKQSSSISVSLLVLPHDVNSFHSSVESSSL